MKIAEIDISRVFLESGKDLKISDKIVVKHPSLKRIMKLGNEFNCDQIYWSYVFSLLCDPYSNMVWLDDHGFDYEEISSFDLFIMRWKECQKEYLKNKEEFDRAGFSPLTPVIDALNFFLGKHNFMIHQIKGQYVLLDADDPLEYMIDSEIFNLIINYLQLINGIKFENRIKPADKNAKMILLEDMRFEQKKRMRDDSQDDSIDLIGKMVAAVAYGGNGSITPFNFYKLKIYQLYTAYAILNNKDHYDQIMSGVYHGTLVWNDVKKQNLDWTK